MLLFLLFARCAMASFKICSNAGVLPIHELYADPLGIVSANHIVYFRLAFNVPIDMYIPSATVHIRTTANELPIFFEIKDYDGHLYPNDYLREESLVFPSGIWGHVRTDISIYNASGKRLLCARWSVFATNRKTNSTNWLISDLYS